MIVCGSTALQFGLEKIGLGLSREPNDLDMMAMHHEVKPFMLAAKLEVVKDSANSKKFLCKNPDGKFVEIEEIVLGSSSHLIWQLSQQYMKWDRVTRYGIEMDIAPLEICYSMKRAHRHSPRNFEKHIADYNFLRRHFKGIDKFERVTAERQRETVAREKLRTPSLNKSTKDFFDDKVSNRTFIHDQIHEVMAHGPRPMFEQYLVAPGSPRCDRVKFDALPPRDKIKAVQEEAYVIALERAIIPMLFEGEGIANPRKAYDWACMRICTTLCSGWFREFALENHDRLGFWYDKNYVEKFLKAVEDGKIKRIER